MITQDLVVFGGGDNGGKKTGQASAATPDNIATIGRPAIHLISGQTGVGKSNVARNIVEAYGDAHIKAGTNPPPDLIIYTGAGGDVVWQDLKGNKRVKMFTPSQETEFVDELLKRYDRAIAQKGGGGTPPESLSAVAKASGAHLPSDGLARTISAKGDADGENQHRPTLVVIDDAGSSDLLPPMLLRSPIIQPLQSHRHSDMSFIISSQRYHNHSPWLRANTASANIFVPSGREERNFLMRELPVPRKSIERGFSVALSKGPHHFIHVDFRNRVATHGFTGQQI